MPFPHSPFSDSFNLELITSLNDEKSNTTTLSTVSNEEYQKTIEWLCSFPKVTSYRVNTLRSNQEIVFNLIRQHIYQILGDSINVEIHPIIPNVVIIYNREVDVTILEKYSKEIIVDVNCAAAILRGAHLYGPGVMGMTAGCQIDDKVSVYGDVSKKCKKGFQKLYQDDKKVFIGNGIVKMTRHDLFDDNLNPNGLAVQMTENVSGCPPLDDRFLPKDCALLQNLPSVLCVYSLNPQPNEIIIDMCASPGNKTTHIAELMQNKGNLIAIDKTPKKVAQLKQKCEDFGAKVHCFQADSTKIISLDPDLAGSVESGPPFRPESFDRVLLDAPCSVLGKRPQLVNRTKESELKSFVPLQRKLFETAVNLLKRNGTLVYSTCTITLNENEGIVAWALRTFESLKLVKPELSLGDSGWVGTTLTEEERHLVQRFGPNDSVDSVGFFIACFIKN